ncbi:MAG: hypothetical protein K8I29_15435, partial [Alphaproteobacteria bacterium]|nr:hypothetical protein [Candidatus Nitrobium versatile]
MKGRGGDITISISPENREEFTRKERGCPLAPYLRLPIQTIAGWPFRFAERRNEMLSISLFPPAAFPSSAGFLKHPLFSGTDAQIILDKNSKVL